VAGVGGVYLIVAGGLRVGDILTHEYFWGNLILLGGALSISIYSILLKRYVTKYGGFVPTFLSMLSGTAVALKDTGVLRAVGFKLLIPVFGIALSVILLGERPGLPTYAGALTAIASAYLIQHVPVRVRKSI
jgi:drug/metabolite transporter (DMT)-like permease